MGEDILEGLEVEGLEGFDGLLGVVGCEAEVWVGFTAVELAPEGILVEDVVFWGCVAGEAI